MQLEPDTLGAVVNRLKRAQGQLAGVLRMIDGEGTPVREFVRITSPVPRDSDSDFSAKRHDERRKQGPEANTHDIERTHVELQRHLLRDV